MEEEIAHSEMENGGMRAAPLVHKMLDVRAQMTSRELSRLLPSGWSPVAPRVTPQMGKCISLIVADQVPGLLCVKPLIGPTLRRHQLMNKSLTPMRDSTLIGWASHVAAPRDWELEPHTEGL